MQGSAEEREVLYRNAKSVMSLWLSKLTDIYDLFFPYRNDIYYHTEAESRQNEIFDETAMVSGRQFANNLQSILMPAFQRWITLVPGKALQEHAAISPDDMKEIESKLQKDTEILFDYINGSNFSQVINEAFQDLTIGTGFIQINEGTLSDPLKFNSIPIGKIITSEGLNGRLENYWREWEVPLRDVKNIWKDIKIPEKHSFSLKNNPDNIVRLIEGCVHYPNNEYDKRYLYYVRFEDTTTDAYKKWMSLSPFVGFRYDKAPGDTLGVGVAQYAYPAAKVLNTMVALDLKSFKFRAFPAYIDASGRSLNPNTARIEPGSLIVVSPDFGGRSSPIQPIPVGGDPRFAQITIQNQQQKIRDIMMAEPLGDITKIPTKTATEMSIRQNNYIRKNAAAASRLAVELIKPIVDRCIEILRNKGLIKDISTSSGIFRMGSHNKVVSIRYKSPIISLQDSKDVNKLVQWTQLMMQTYGPQGTLASIERYNVPYWVAEKLGVDLELIKSSTEFQNDAEQAAQTMMKLQQASQGSGQQDAQAQQGQMPQ